MPYEKKRENDKWQVINAETGDVKGTHDSESEANDQLAALAIHASDKVEKMDEITAPPRNFFIPIAKVDAERREVYGWGTIEEPDQANEIMDWETSRPYLMQWSASAQKRSGGKSLGNVRAMHQPIAAGKLIAFTPDDEKRGIYVGAKIIDEESWRKVEEGVFTGFSIGGSYVRRWADQKNPGVVRYTAKPAELSIVDAPCVPSATFQVIKAAGAETTMHFSANGNGANAITVDVEDGEIEGEELEKAEKSANDFTTSIKAPDPLVTIGVFSDGRQAIELDRMPDTFSPMEIKPGKEPDQETLMDHAVTKKDLEEETNALLAALPDLVKSTITLILPDLVKSAVTQAVNEYVRKEYEAQMSKAVTPEKKVIRVVYNP